MNKSKLHTFRDIIDKGVWVEPEDNSIPGHYEKISCLYIPKIQRDYAQGRESEREIRNDFLKELFDSLENQTELELSFIFGSKQQRGKKTEGFEILDGQQRLTTLFLLYWYTAMREFKAESRPILMEKFTYETRDTSSYFLAYLTGNDEKLELNGQKFPSEIIKGRKWFTDEYLCDPTVMAILGMLDSIHIRYNQLVEKIGSPIYDRLGMLKFYILMLENFEMSDELYIKMNSRGLSLTPFENFKASIIRFMKGYPNLYDEKFRLDFIAKTDAVWIDFFWKNSLDPDAPVTEIINIDDKEIGWEYMTFFNRYFFTKAALKLSSKSEYDIIKFFYDQTTATRKERLTGWSEFYIPLFEKDPGIFNNLEKVCDELYKNLDIYLDIIRDDKRNYSNFPSFLRDISDHQINNAYRIADMVAFALLTEFIESIPRGMDIKKDKVVEENFKRACRIMFNVVENTQIESVNAAISVIRGLSEVVRLPNAQTGNLYESLKNEAIKSDNRQLKEEKEKAEQMFVPSDSFHPQWEEAFIEAEQHPFFKGSVGFFFEPSIPSPSEFTARFNTIKPLFDKDGITKDWKADRDHILIRAIIAALNTLNSLKEIRVTERSTEKYLKNIIIGSPSVKKLFCGFFNQTDSNSIEDYLREVVYNAKIAPNEDESTVRLYTRLVNDPEASHVYDWIATIEKGDKNGLFKIQVSPLRINVPYERSNYLYFHMERRTLLPRIMTANGLQLTDMNSWNPSLKDFVSKHVMVTKTIRDSLNNPVTLDIDFDEWGWAVFRLPLDLKDALLTSKRIEESQVRTSFIEFKKFWYGKDNQEVREKINDIIDEIENVVSTLSL